MLSLMRVPALARSLLHELSEFCYPSACAHCGEAPHSPEVSHFPLCPACEGGLLRAGVEPACPFCGKLLGQEGAGCQSCFDKGLPHLEQVARLSTYEGPARTLLLATKFQGHWSHAVYLGRAMSGHPHVRALLAATDVIVPVPLHPLRQWKRGFNQAELLARALAEGGGAPVQPLLKRRRNTQLQSRQSSPTQRKINLKDAFAVRKPERVGGKRVLLVDDILTTGATAVEAARALRKAGAKSVSVATVAVPDLRSAFDEE